MRAFFEFVLSLKGKGGGNGGGTGRTGKAGTQVGDSGTLTDDGRAQ